MIGVGTYNKTLVMMTACLLFCHHRIDKDKRQNVFPTNLSLIFPSPIMEARRVRMHAALVHENFVCLRASEYYGRLHPNEPTPSRQSFKRYVLMDNF